MTAQPLCADVSTKTAANQASSGVLLQVELSSLWRNLTQVTFVAQRNGVPQLLSAAQTNTVAIDNMCLSVIVPTGAPCGVYLPSEVILFSRHNSRIR